MAVLRYEQKKTGSPNEGHGQKLNMSVRGV